MASENCPRVSATAARHVLRAGAVVAGLAAALSLTACDGEGSSGGSPAGGAPSPSSAAASASSSAAASGGTQGGAGGGTGGAPDSGRLEGSWLATTGGKAVVLVVSGDEAGLFATGGNVCSGSADGASGADSTSGSTVIHLTCSDGGQDRAKGTVESVGGSSLVVRWNGLGKETYTKAKGGRLPSGFPTSTSGLVGSPAD